MPRLKSLLVVASIVGATLLPHSAGAAGPKIVVILKAHTAFWKAVEKGATEAGQRLGAEVVVKAPLNDTDVAVQIQLLNAGAAQGAAAVVVAPINSNALAVPIASVAVQGTKVVIIDTPIAGKAAPVFVGTDQLGSGEAAGALLAKLVSDTDEAAILLHNQSSGATLDREKGATEAFRKVHPKSPLHADIYGGSEPGAEEAKCELLLERHPHIAAVLTTGSSETFAMLRVLQRKKLATSIKLIGFGFNLNPEVAAALDHGEMNAWIAQQPTEFGIRGVESALALIKGEAVPPVVHTDFLIITKENLADSKVQALLAL
jgi:ribose transport system substrate-binding protein